MVPWKVEAVQPLRGYRLEVTFADGVHGVVDLSDVPHKGVFALWSEPGYFEQVRVDAETGTVCWPNGADVAPDAMYEEVKRRNTASLGGFSCVSSRKWCVMPDLNVLDETPENVFSEVMEKMMFPDDEYLSDCYHCLGVAKRHLGDNAFWSDLRDPLMGELRAMYLRNIMNKLLYCPSVDDMKKKQEKAFKECFVVGLSVINIYKLHVLGEDASFGKAAYATRRMIEKSGLDLPISDIEKKIRKYKKSAHLSAAMILYISSRGNVGVNMSEEMAILLSAANQFYKFGREYRPSGAKPIFNGDMWTVPAGYPLVDVDLPSQTSDTAIIAAMRSYEEGKEWEANW